MKKLLLYMTILSIHLSQAAIYEETLEYKDGNTTLEAFIASPETKNKAPGVLVVHDWMGPGEYSKMRARHLAELGYVAFAADIYGKGVRPKSPAEAGKLAGSYKNDPKKLRARVNAALKALKKLKTVDKNNIAALGYCFGGTSVLELARSGANVNAIISFHGGLSSKDPIKKHVGLKPKILVLHGADDPHVPPAEVAAFEEEMKTAGADWQLHAYGNAVHAFTQKHAGNDNSKGAAYNEKADKRSFESMKLFLAEAFN